MNKIPEYIDIVEMKQEQLSTEYDPYDDIYIDDEYYEKRYMIIDKETGEIINDAQGYGFKSKQAAYKFLYYKLNKGEIISTKKNIQKWWKEHKDIRTQFDIMLMDSVHESGNVPVKEFMNLINEYNIKLPYKAKLMMKYYV